MTALAEPTTINTTVAPAETMADLLHRLGDISPNRVRIQPPPGTATVEDVVAIEAHENRLFELVDGVLVEKCMGYWESYLAGRILTDLNIWVLPRNLGVVTGADGMVRLFPKMVRMPDVAFTQWKRFPNGKPTRDPVPELAPDLAVEVLSEGNTEAEMQRKREEYFRAGVRLLWIIDPKTRSANVFSTAENFVVLQKDQSLDGGDVLPGFSLSLSELFANLPA